MKQSFAPRQWDYTSHAGSGWPPTPGPTDGLFDVLALPRLSRLYGLGFVPEIAKATHTADPRAPFFKARRIAVDTPQPLGIAVMDTIPPIEHRRGPYYLSTNPALLDVTLIHTFLSSESYWAKGISRELVERSLANSLNFGLFEAAAQIGFARVVTDYATYGYLNDVFVLDAYRGRGLGKWLLECVAAHPALQTLLRFSVATRDAQALYAKVGFRPLRYPERHMEKLPPGYYKESE